MSNNLTLGFTQIHPILKNVGIALLILSLFLPNTTLLIYSILCLYIIINTSWPKHHPPVILVCLIFQWLQASTKVFQASLEGTQINTFTQSQFAAQAVFLSLTGIIIVSLGFRVSVNTPLSIVSKAQIKRSFNEKKIFYLFLLSFATAQTILAIAPSLPGGIYQILLSISNVQWIAYSILFIAVLQQNGNFWFLIIAFSLELSVNLFGYFSSFREVILFTIILYIPFIKKLTIKSLALYSILFYLIFTFFVGWTGIKDDFRKTLQTSGNLDYTDRATAFYDMYTSFDEYESSTDKGLDRLSYTDMLMYSLETVPAVTPHENGSLWVGAIQHILMPRFLFPDKKILNDSEKANLYTGRQWAGAEEGTSISIGYVTESYVDFGFFMMFIPLFLLGYIIGFLYKKIYAVNIYLIITLSSACTIFFFTKFSLLEISGDKLLGAIVSNFIVIYFLTKKYSNKIIHYITSKN